MASKAEILKAWEESGKSNLPERLHPSMNESSTILSLILPFPITLPWPSWDILDWWYFDRLGMKAYLAEFAGIYYDENTTEPPSITRAVYVENAVNSFNEQRLLGHETTGGGAGAVFIFYFHLNAVMKEDSGGTRATTFKAAAGEPPASQSSSVKTMLTRYHEVLENNLVEGTWLDSADDARLDNALRGKAALSEDYAQRLEITAGEPSDIPEEGETRFEEGDLIQYAQCALMYDFVRSDGLQDNYMRAVKDRLKSNNSEEKTHMPWNGRIVPLWVNEPEKFINYCNFSTDYGELFKNLSMIDKNFSMDSKTVRSSTDYGKLGLSAKLRFIYKGIITNDDGTEEETLVDLDLKLNSENAKTVNFMMYKLASAVVSAANTSGEAEASRDTFVRKQSGGIFQTYDDAKGYTPEGLTARKATDATPPAGYVSPGNSFISLTNINVKFDGTNPSTARKDVEVELEWELDSFYTLMFENLTKLKEKITLADLVSLPLTNKRVNGSDLGSYLKSQYSPNYNRLQLIITSSTITETDKKDVEVTKQEYDVNARKTNQQTKVRDEDFVDAEGEKTTTTIMEKRDEKYFETTTKTEIKPANDLIIDLAIIDHSLERDSGTGFLTFKLNYRGYFDSMLSAPACDALADAEINRRRQKRDGLLRSAVERKCSRDEIRRLMQINNNIAQQEKKKSLQSILKRLAAKKRMYKTFIPKQWINHFVSKGHFPPKPKDFDKLVKFPWMMFWGGPSDEDIETIVAGGGAPAQADAKAVEDNEASTEGQFLTYCFFLGDLLDVIGDGLYKDKTNQHLSQYKEMNLKFMATTFSIANLTEGSKTEDDRIKHILAVPIELDFFIRWFNETVINKDLIYYPIATMIKDLIERVISSLLHETCFSSPEDLPPLFRVMYMSDCRPNEGEIGSIYERWQMAQMDEGGEGFGKKYGKGSAAASEKTYYLDVEKWVGQHQDQPFFFQDHNVATKDRENYCIIYCMRPMILNRAFKYNIENDEDSFKKYVPVLNYGMQKTDANYLSDVKFSKTNTPGLRESRYFSAINGSLSLMSNVYDLSFSFVKRAGNTLFFPGQIFDFRLLDFGLGSPHDPGSHAFHLGFGGYHIVKSVTYNLTQLSTDYVISVESKFLDTKASKQFSRVNEAGEKKVEENPNQALCDLILDRAEKILHAELAGTDMGEVYAAADIAAAVVEQANAEGEFPEEREDESDPAEVEKLVQIALERTDLDQLAVAWDILDGGGSWSTYQHGKFECKAFSVDIDSDGSYEIVKGADGSPDFVEILKNDGDVAQYIWDGINLTGV